MTTSLAPPGPFAPPVGPLDRPAAATSARLVVIGLRRRSPVGKLVTGSDAQRLLLDLDVPILAVKPTR